jgi:hypothetical protein
MVDPDRTVMKLHAAREELLDQLAIVDKALAALTGARVTLANTPEPNSTEAAEEATSPVVARRVKSPRVLSDKHRQALIDGLRKARHSKEAAAGRAREMPDPFPGLALASTAPQLPRLVKRQRPKTLVSEPLRARR